MLALQLESGLGEFEAGQQILPLQIPELCQHVLERVTSSQVLEDGLDRIPPPANDRLAVADLRIDRNT